MPNAPYFQDSILLGASYGFIIRNLARENRFSTGQPLEARQPERYDKESDQMKNGIMMQYFEWNLPNDGQFWNKLKEDAPT